MEGEPKQHPVWKQILERVLPVGVWARGQAGRGHGWVKWTGRAAGSWPAALPLLLPSAWVRVDKWVIKRCL